MKIAYCKRGKFHWAKLALYSHYMDFPVILCGARSGRLYVVLKAKDSWEKLSHYSKNHKSLAQRNFPHLRYIHTVALVQGVTVICSPNRKQLLAMVSSFCDLEKWS